jgi:hypothetical protein
VVKAVRRVIIDESEGVGPQFHRFGLKHRIHQFEPRPQVNRSFQGGDKLETGRVGSRLDIIKGGWSGIRQEAGLAQYVDSLCECRV